MNLEYLFSSRTKALVSTMALIAFSCMTAFAQDTKTTSPRSRKTTTAPAATAKAAPVPTAPAQPTVTQPAPAPAAKAAKGGATQNATPAQIADAKAKGMVWVNTGTGVYHKDGEFYGATKAGKFMTEADAMKANYRAAKTGGKAKAAKAATAK